MASNSAEVDSKETISDMITSNVPDDEIPPPVLHAQEEEVAMEQRNKQEVEVPDGLKELPGYQALDWRAFCHKRHNGHIDRTYTHKDYRHQFRSKREVELFIKTNGMTTGMFRGRKLQKKNIAGTDAQDAGTSKFSGRRASAKHAKAKRPRSPSRSVDDDDEIPPGFL